ncbi:MAG: alpha/beta hydrolase [Spiroplasma sp.]|nr:alpha/beta hydrolase [Spiroplasma sp.]
MKNTKINFFKLKRRVDIDSIEMFHACLKYNTKLTPMVEFELNKWPIYLEYWNQLVANKNIHSFKVQSSIDKITLVGDYITTPVKNNNNNRTIFLLHGITNTRYWIFKQVYTFLQAGYNVVWYDARNHGESDEAPTTFGKNEAWDLQDIIDYIVKNYQPKNMIVYGFSLGAASVVMWSDVYHQKPNKNNNNIRLLIADSTFAQLEQSYIEQINNYSFIPTNLAMKLFHHQIKKMTGFADLSTLQPIKYLKYIPKIPILFLHGQSDYFISYTNTQELYNEKIRYEEPIKTKVYLVKEAIHGQCFLIGDNPQATIFDEYNQPQDKKISELVLDYIDQIIN